METQEIVIREQECEIIQIPIMWLNGLIETYSIEMKRAFDEGRRTQGYVYRSNIDLIEKIKTNFNGK